jgi:Ca2+-binding RTX toxin-like protein
MFFGLALVVTATAHGQSAVLVGRTLFLSGTNAADMLGVVPNQAATGYVADISGNPRAILNANTGTNVNVVASNLVDSIEIHGGSGDDILFLGKNFYGDTLFDVNSGLEVTIIAGSGNDTIDPGVTGYGRDVFLFGGWGFDTLHSYYVLLNGVRVYLSPPLLDASRMDTTVAHRISSYDQFPLSSPVRRF